MRTATKKIAFSDYHPAPSDFYAEVIDGLSQIPKSIPPKFFYDEAGSRLFDAICDLPEYYPTRTEMAILSKNAAEIANIIGEQSLIIEPGSGSSKKVRLLLDEFKPHAYMPMDISKQHLINAAHELAEDYPWLHIHAACADFTTELTIPEPRQHQRKIAFFPGSSIGNFEPEDAIEFLKHLSSLVGENGGLLIGVDLKKDSAILHDAYNDKQGITAQFNKNLLTRINRELNADFDQNQFEHYAFYNSDKGRIEMHLISQRLSEVTIGSNCFEFAESESLHTENSYKYTIEEFQSLAAQSGFQLQQVWTDNQSLFSLQYYEANN